MYDCPLVASVPLFKHSRISKSWGCLQYGNLSFFLGSFFSLDIIPFNRFKKKIIFLFIADITMIFLPNVLSSLWQRHNFNLYFYPAIISISHQDCIFDLHNCVSSWWQGCTCVDSHTVSRLYGISRLLNDSFIEINCIIYSTLHYHFA